MNDQGVTVVVVRTVKAGHESECEAWLHGVAEVAGRFPGHLGMTIFRPHRGSRDYTFVFRFETQAQLDAWDASPEREEWLEKSRSFTEKFTVHRHTGLETWFQHPDAHVLVPPRWKMVVVSWCVAFPLIQILSRTLGTISLHPLLRGALVGLAMVVMMTYAAMPAATRALRAWLYRPSSERQ